MTHLLVMALVALCDVGWTMYFKKVGANKAFAAAAWSAFIVACSGLAVMSYTTQHTYLLDAIIGSFVGTYLTLITTSANVDLDEPTIRGWVRAIKIAKYQFGFESTEAKRPIEGKYLHRWIVYVGVVSLRLHKFYRGDTDDACHNHPWWFVTFPLSPYRERIYVGKGSGTRTVKAFRFHYRPAGFRHVVLHGVRRAHLQIMRGDWASVVAWESHDRPFYTLVVSGVRMQQWGFWRHTEPGTFVHHKEYLNRVVNN